MTRGDDTSKRGGASFLCTLSNSNFFEKQGGRPVANVQKKQFTTTIGAIAPKMPTVHAP